jgi:hypothetical protein
MRWIIVPTLAKLEQEVLAPGVIGAGSKLVLWQDGWPALCLGNMKGSSPTPACTTTAGVS